MNSRLESPEGPPVYGGIPHMTLKAAMCSFPPCTGAPRFRQRAHARWRTRSEPMTKNHVDALTCGTSHWRRWGVVLAVADGSRLLSLSRRIAGDYRPRQVCYILGSASTLLHH